MGETADFSGYATKAGLKCSDGRTIQPGAFEHQDKMTVPLVWQHGHSEPENVLGHAILENRADGVYAHGYFNETSQGQNAKALVQHGDITMLSIFANQLVERSKQVFHGIIREVSLVLAGANPGAKIDFVAIQHADGTVDQLDDEAVITTGLEIEHADASADSGPTVQEVYDSMTPEQQDVLHYMIGAAVEGVDTSATHSDTSSDTKSDDKSEDKSDDQSNKDDLTHKEGTIVTNVFEKDSSGGTAHALSHDDVRGIVADAMKGGSLKEAVEAYAIKHGIENIDTLFPDAKSVQDRPEWIKRQTDWVAGVISGTRKTPFSRIKSMTADLTYEDARAKGYIKGNLKKEQFFGVSKRETTPQTIYKKQKLDRDDIVDITDFDVVAWLKVEMRFMLEEELARAILIGDGREVDDEDKIKEDKIRPIATDDELYVTTVNVNIDDADSDYNEVVEEVLLARRFYKGSGSPTFYTTEEMLTRMLLSKDNFGRRRYNTEQELASAMRVSSIVPVEVMEDEPDLVGIVVNLVDYVLGADRGGEINLFDDFDIDYNQYKYLIETRVSGALVKVKAALVIRRTAGANVLRVPVEPAFDATTGALTITDTTGVVYKHGATTLNAAGSPYDVPAGTTWTVDATPAAGSYFATSENDSWDFTADA